MNEQGKTNGIPQRKYDLQERFIEYAVKIIRLSESLPETKAGKHICSQMLRSGTSPAPNYGEAQGAESKADFIHKLKIALKELRETEVWLRIITRAKMIQPTEKMESLLRKTDELIFCLMIIESLLQWKLEKPQKAWIHKGFFLVLMLKHLMKFGNGNFLHKLEVKEF